MRRLLVLLLALVIVAPATATTPAPVCKDMGMPMPDSHGCCNEYSMPAPNSSRLCCAAAPQTRVRGPIEPRVAAPQQDLEARLHAASMHVDPDTRFVSVALPPPAQNTRHVPLYLAQLALLI